MIAQKLKLLIMNDSAHIYHESKPATAEDIFCTSINDLLKATEESGGDFVLPKKDWDEAFPPSDISGANFFAMSHPVIANETKIIV